jgi:molybdate transport system ATP-binding protein
VRFQTDVPFAALYGPSGAGKSLTLQAIAGLLHPSAGHVRLDGRTLYDSAQRIDVPAPERRIGYLFQNYALFPHLTVRENVSFGLTSWRRRSLPPKEAERCRPCSKASVSLAGRQPSAEALRRPAAARGAGACAGLRAAGAAARRALRRAQPDAAQRTAQRARAGARQWGIPVLMITHDIEDVLALADVAFVYKDGQVVREIDLHTAESRDIALREVAGVPVVEETPLRSKLRGLLMHAGHPGHIGLPSFPF